MQENPLQTWFDQHQGRLLHKWSGYFEVYHRHLQRWCGQSPTVLEIGVFHGGSLQMWRDYFGPGAKIHGIDINPECRKIVEPGCQVHIGSQSDRAFLRKLLAEIGPVDIVIDDGGHRMEQLLVSFQELFFSMKADGVYIAEDLHTCYWRDYGGGYRNPASFMEVAKQLIDQLHAWHSRDRNSFLPDAFTGSAHSMHFYDSMLVIEKRDMAPPQYLYCGSQSFADPSQDGLDRVIEDLNQSLRQWRKAT
jgi:hypothetical protein